MVSRENKVITLCIVLDFSPDRALYQVESFPEWWGYAAFILIGTVLPTAINEYLDRKGITV